VFFALKAKPSGRRYFRAEKLNNFWLFSRLFVPLTTSKVLSLKHAKQKKALFCFAFSSLIRTFAGG
jgi:hypothetical protein